MYHAIHPYIKLTYIQATPYPGGNYFSEIEEGEEGEGGGRKRLIQWNFLGSLIFLEKKVKNIHLYQLHKVNKMIKKINGLKYDFRFRDFLGELEYWGLSALHLEPCCAYTMQRASWLLPIADHGVDQEDEVQFNPELRRHRKNL